MQPVQVNEKSQHGHGTVPQLSSMTNYKLYMVDFNPMDYDYIVS